MFEIINFDPMLTGVRELWVIDGIEGLEILSSVFRSNVLFYYFEAVYGWLTFVAGEYGSERNIIYLSEPLFL